MRADIKHLGANPTDEEILRNYVICRDAEIMGKGFTPDMIEFFRRQATKMKTTLVCVCWRTGECVMLFCIPGTCWPDPRLVIEAFKRGRAKFKSRKTGGRK